MATSPTRASVKNEQSSSYTSTARATASASTLAVPGRGGGSGQPSSANTPRGSMGADAGKKQSLGGVEQTAANGRDIQQHTSLFDGTHITTLYGRIGSLSNLIIKASQDPNSLAVPSSEGADAKDEDVAMTEADLARQSTLAPNIALGATTDDDVDAGYESALFAAQARSDRDARPTELAQSIVRESVELREAFRRAQQSIAQLEGGEMDIEEQHNLLAMLNEYSGEQDRLRRTFSKNSDFVAEQALSDRVTVDG